LLPICRHIKTSGIQCAGIALRGRNFCFHHDKLHIDRRSSALRSQIRSQPPMQTYEHGTMLVPDREPVPPYPVSLEFPEEPAAILTNIYRVATLLLQGHIDRPTANSVTYGMQVCLSALSGKPLSGPAATPASTDAASGDSETDSDSGKRYYDPSNPPQHISRPVHRVILTPDGDEIAPPAEILEDNEAEPVHHKDCPCMNCAEKYRNRPPELHHPECTCGLCEEQDSGTGTNPGAPSLAQPKVGNDTSDQPTLIPDPCALTPRQKPRIARASALFSATTNRDPLLRPWSVAEYTFGDAIRRHEAQYAARAAACLAVGIEPPPYQPYTAGLIPPGSPDYEEEQKIQQHSSEYWAEHFRKQIAERPDIQQYLAEAEAS